MNKTFQLVFEAESEGGYTVTVPSLPGCITYGETLEDARAMAREAISLYLEDVVASGEPLPEGNDVFVGSMEVELTSNA